MKKNQDNICWSSEMSARDNFPKMIETSKNLKNCIVCLEFQCPKRRQTIPKLISLALLNVEFYNFGQKFLMSIYFPDYYPCSAMEVLGHCCKFGSRILDYFKGCKIKAVLLRDDQNFKRGISKRGDQI